MEHLHQPETTAKPTLAEPALYLPGDNRGTVTVPEQIEKLIQDYGSWYSRNAWYRIEAGRKLRLIKAEMDSADLSFKTLCNERKELPAYTTALDYLRAAEEADARTEVPKEALPQVEGLQTDAQADAVQQATEVAKQEVAAAKSAITTTPTAPATSPTSAYTRNTSKKLPKSQREEVAAIKQKLTPDQVRFLMYQPFVLSDKFGYDMVREALDLVSEIHTPEAKPPASSTTTTEEAKCAA